jgi:hypothetical protein
MPYTLPEKQANHFCAHD